MSTGDRHNPQRRPPSTAPPASGAGDAVDDLVREVGAACGEPAAPAEPRALDDVAALVEAIECLDRAPDLEREAASAPGAAAVTGAPPADEASFAPAPGQGAPPSAPPPLAGEPSPDPRPPNEPDPDPGPEPQPLPGDPGSDPGEDLGDAEMVAPSELAGLGATAEEAGVEVQEQAEGPAAGPRSEDPHAPRATEPEPLPGAAGAIATEAPGSVTLPEVGAPVELPDAAPEPAGEPALRGVDEALADDVDDLLQGSYETVSAVLDEESGKPEAGMIREDPPPAGDGGQGQPERPADEPAGDAARPQEGPADRAAQDTRVVTAEDAQQEIDELDEAAGFKTVDELLEQGEGTASDAADSGAAGGDPVAPPEAHADVATALHASEFLPPREDAASANPPEDAESPSDAGEGEKAAEGLPEFDAAGEASDAVPDEPDGEGGLWSRIEPVLVAGLRPMSAPLRKVPSRWRPIVDWVALSLVFWVPIVWILVLFFLGR